jgi:hypothetical protein
LYCLADFAARFAHFIRNYSKTFTGITGARCLNRCVKRQNICLEGISSMVFDNLADIF